MLTTLLSLYVCTQTTTYMAIYQRKEFDYRTAAGFFQSTKVRSVSVKFESITFINAFVLFFFVFDNNDHSMGKPARPISVSVFLDHTELILLIHTLGTVNVWMVGRHNVVPILCACKIH